MKKGGRFGDFLYLLAIGIFVFAVCYFAFPFSEVRSSVSAGDVLCSRRFYTSDGKSWAYFGESFSVAKVSFGQGVDSLAFSGSDKNVAYFTLGGSQSVSFVCLSSETVYSVHYSSYFYFMEDSGNV